MKIENLESRRLLDATVDKKLEQPCFFSTGHMALESLSGFVLGVAGAVGAVKIANKYGSSLPSTLFLGIGVIATSNIIAIGAIAFENVVNSVGCPNPESFWGWVDRIEYPAMGVFVGDFTVEMGLLAFMLMKPRTDANVDAAAALA